MGTKGGTFPLLSAVKHKGDSYFLQHDHDTHVAWTGKHVAAALQDHRLHDAPPGGSWAPIVTDFILDRRPWQR